MMIDSNNRKIYGNVTGTIFLLDSLVLMISTLSLRKTLTKHFADSLSDEAAMLKCLFILFTISYLIRTFLFFA